MMKYLGLKLQPVIMTCSAELK